MWRPDEIWIERSEVETALAQTVLERTSGVPVRVVDDPRAGEVGEFASGKRRLILQQHRGKFLQACPAGTSGLVCCSYLVANFASNCPFDCSYCFLQEHLANNPAVKAYTNFEAGLSEIDDVLHAHPKRNFRIGTGELADSLALDPITGLSSRLVSFFAERPNAVLELKTKSDCVDDLPVDGATPRIVVSWSINPQELIVSDESGTASLERRLAAARKVQGKGYSVGFHFDPVIEFDGWEAAYERTIAAVASSVTLDSVAWISLGSLRLTPRMMTIMRARHRPGRALASELVACSDGKARVWRGLRLHMYRSLVSQLRAHFPAVSIYLCMEPPAVWQQVMNEVPTPQHLGMRLTAPAAW